MSRFSRIEVLNELLQIGMKNYLGERARTCEVGDEIVSQMKKQQI